MRAQLNRTKKSPCSLSFMCRPFICAHCLLSINEALLSVCGVNSFQLIETTLSPMPNDLSETISSNMRKNYIVSTQKREIFFCLFSPRLPLAHDLLGIIIDENFSPWKLFFFLHFEQWEKMFYQLQQHLTRALWCKVTGGRWWESSSE